MGTKITGGAAACYVFAGVSALITIGSWAVKDIPTLIAAGIGAVFWATLGNGVPRK